MEPAKDAVKRTEGPANYRWQSGAIVTLNRARLIRKIALTFPVIWHLVWHARAGLGRFSWLRARNAARENTLNLMKTRLLALWIATFAVGMQGDAFAQNLSSKILGLEKEWNNAYMHGDIT